MPHSTLPPATLPFSCSMDLNLNELSTSWDEPTRSGLPGHKQSNFSQKCNCIGRLRDRLSRGHRRSNQWHTYNKDHKPCEFQPGDLVLVNLHELEWSESKGEGAKLIQCWIGPFEVTEHINPKMYRLRMDDHYLGTPIFNLDHLRKYVHHISRRARNQNMNARHSNQGSFRGI